MCYDDGMANDDRQLTRYVHTGQVVRSIGDMRVGLQVDTQGINAAMVRLKAAFAGVAVPVLRTPGESSIIDMDGATPASNDRDRTAG